MKYKIYTIGLLLLASMLFQSCADNKELVIKGKVQTVEPYGWADVNEVKNPDVNYKLCVGNVIWSLILSETFIVPIWLTGWQIYEPVSTKIESK